MGETMHWVIDTDEIAILQKSWHVGNKEFEAEPPFFGPEFEVENIRFKCELDWNSRYYGTEGFNALRFHASMPKDVHSLSVYIESYCKENKAEFRETQTLSRYFRDIERDENVWVQSNTQ